MTKAIVAQFYKSKGGRLTLWSLVTEEEEKARDGSEKIWIHRRYYDVDISKKYGYLYHQSGAGGSHPIRVDGIYFSSGEIFLKEEPCQLLERSKTGRWKSRDIRIRNKTRRIPTLPKKFRLENGGDLFEWLEVHGIQGDSVYCSECRDRFPEDSLCRHCWWCDKTGWWSTPSERCKCKDSDECQQ